MLTVLIDTSTPAISAGLARIHAGGVELLAQRATVDARAHGELLAPQIAEVLRQASVRPGELAAVVAGVGPGPFTGLRVGLVTATALSQALGVPSYGVCSLDAIGAATTGRVLVATDARRREIYWARYLDGRRVTEPAVGHPVDVLAMLAAVSPEAAAGDGAQRYADALGLPVRPPRYPSLAALAELAAARVRANAPGEPLVPLYLRRPDAVEMARA